MTRTQFVFRNTVRNRRRTILTVASVTVSTYLVTILWASYRYLQAPPEMDRTHLILSVTARTSVTIPLPISYQSQIAKVPGVAAAMPLRWFDGRYGKDADLVPALAVDARKLLVFLSDWHVPEDQLQAFIGERDALVAGRKVSEGYHIGGAMPAHIRVDAITMALSLLVAVTVDLGSTLLPAHHAARLNVAEALRFVG